MFIYLSKYDFIWCHIPNYATIFIIKLDTSNLWTLATLVCRIEALWKIICDTDLRTSEWNGWMLVYLIFFVSINAAVDKLVMNRLNIDTCQLWLASYQS